MSCRSASLWTIAVVVACSTILLDPSHSQSVPPNPATFTCTGKDVSTNCTNGDQSLRHFTGATGAPFKYVITQGYFDTADGGGGTFYDIGDASTHCKSFTTGNVATISTNSKTIGGFTSVANLQVGELVSSGTLLTPGTEIASINTTTKQITVTLYPVGNSSTASVTFTGDNGGTLIVDNEQSPYVPQCYQKVDYHGEPHEFGAVGDAVTDDTIALENWLGAYGVPSSSTQVLTNFGPWNASLPANYLVTAPLFCPPNALLQGLGTETDGPSPLVRIFAARQNNQSGLSFSGTGPSGVAVLTLSDRCRVSGLSIDGGGVQLSGTTTSGTLLDNLPSVSQIQLGDVVTAGDIPSGTTVTFVNGMGTGTNCSLSTTTPCVTLSAAATGSNSELVSFNGPNSVAITGSRTMIDGHSLIENGYNNVKCPHAAQYGLQIKDSQFIASGSDNLVLNGCSNLRVIGNIVYNSGGSGAVFNAADMTFNNNAVEQSAGIGVDLTGAHRVSLAGNMLDDNGKGVNGGAAVEVSNAQTISICNNHLSGNGEYSANSGQSSAQIHFGGTNDAIDLCGNVYRTELQSGDATWKPYYAYDSGTSTLFTNSNLFETPGPQAFGVYSTNATPILSQLQVPQLVPGQISGFTLSNASSTAVAISSGAAADSSGSVLIQIPGTSSPCTVDIGTNTGETGLDTGSSNIAQNTTYFYYVIAQAGGGATSCIASASPTGPSFLLTTTGKYSIRPTATGLVGDPYVYNVSTVTGLKPGDLFGATSGVVLVPANTTVDHVGTITVNTEGCSTTCSSGSSTITVASGDYASLRLGMAISDGPVYYSPGCAAAGGTVAQSAIKDGTVITGLPGSNQVQLSQSLTSSIKNDCITASAGNVVWLANSHTVSNSGSALQYIFTGVYRMVGALYTMPSSTSVVSFTQDEDTFTLATSAQVTPSIGTSSTAIPFTSVPSQMSVKASGRCSAGAPISLTGGNETAQQPHTPFTTKPGYAINNPTPVTSYPFSLYTAGAGTSAPGGSINAYSTTASTTVTCYNDGWVWHRGK